MKKYILYIFCGYLLLQATACKDFLDREPISSPTDKNFWKTEAEGNSGVAATYALLRKALNESSGMAYFIYGDLATQEINLPNSGIDNDYKLAGYLELNANVPAAETWRPMMQLRRYDNFYRIIDQANRCMELVPQIPLSEYTSGNPAQARDIMIGEAYFMRAYAYFYMARIWGDVPLVTKSVANLADAVNLPRTPQAEILAQALLDVEKATAMLTYSYSNSGDRAVRANKAVAFALKAHIYAWQGDYAKCIPAADSVIANGGYSLVSRANFPGIFKGQSPEGIFEIAMNAENEGTQNGIAFRTLKDPYLKTNTGDANIQLNVAKLRELYPDSTEDLRVATGFASFLAEKPFCIKYSNIFYMQPNNAAPIARNNMIIFRLADILLLKAEALAATSKFGDARTILNNIRAMAGIKDWTGSDADLFAGVISERGRELFMEGHRFYDLIRLARVKQVYTQFGTNANGIDKLDAAKFTQGKYYWPIDPVLLNVNRNLTQTPYWTDKM